MVAEPPQERLAAVAAAEPVLPPLRQAARELGLRAWVVGGYVRDALLGRPHPDLDVVVEGPQALALAERFARLVGARPPALFPRFGTAQVTWGERRVEFASTRAESYAPTSRKPEVRPATLAEDLLRRDFTVNAMLMDLDGRLHDPLGGWSDLQRRRLRTPRPAEQAFSDDPLRMLRAIRFAAQLGFELDAPLLPAMRRLRDRARPPVLSAERVNGELRKMLVSPRPRRALELLDEGGLMETLLPEVFAGHGVAQGHYHRWDVFGHTLETVARTPPDLLVRLAALFHDVGKPVTATPDGAFHGHDQVGAELTRAAMTRLRFANAEVERVARMVRLHLRPVFYRPEWSDGAVRRLARDAGDVLWPLLELARADIAASAYPGGGLIDELEGRLRAVLAERPSRMRLPIDGRDIMRVCDLSPGPEVGRIKARLEELVLEGTLPPDREALLAYLGDHHGRRRER
ncbi:MAG TPA: HD domain-containing protein [Candidatus Dormibacteraeota bacterium]|nr:HD domain-containing protein [Candidatus Dormibacteraeota bacterium]